MSNIIAVIWDFDKTLVNGYMQDPIFKHYGVNGADFWKEVDALPEKYMREQHVRVNPDTIYLNHFINCTKDGRFAGLNNARLREFGKELKFYPGVPEIFEKTSRILEEDERFAEYDIRVEHYIVSTGMSEIIRGSSVADHVEYIWGCELIESPNPVSGETEIAEIGYTIDNTTKTRAIFEINKGTPKNEVDVNAKIPEDMRRVPFENMIYIADGPSDVPAFSLVGRFGGATFAIYPAGDARAFKQVEKLRADGRVHMYAEADYTEGKTACMWICSKILEKAEQIILNEKERLKKAVSDAPKHLGAE